MEVSKRQDINTGTKSERFKRYIVLIIPLCDLGWPHFKFAMEGTDIALVRMVMSIEPSSLVE